MEKKVPMRTCVACRSSKPKKELVRIVKNQNGITLDRTGKVNGRGAYICDDTECLRKLIKGKILNKVFECEVSDETYKLIEVAFSDNKQ